MGEPQQAISVFAVSQAIPQRRVVSLDYLMPRLLVSVRNVDEARDALAGGADLIDIKEPRRGSLGQADASVIREIACMIGGRTSLSAALGELLESPGEIPSAGVTYVKWGLSGCGLRNDWPSILAERGAAVRRPNPGCQLVAVAYADWQRSNAPRPSLICEAAMKVSCSAVLVDTFQKDGTSLFSWLTGQELFHIREETRKLGLQLALAGGIDLDSLRAVLEIQPDWVAVRGAVCVNGRQGSLCPDKVRRMARAVHEGAKVRRPSSAVGSSAFSV
jgi:uncharacterized protein (UPF0264 family)